MVRERITNRIFHDAFLIPPPEQEAQLPLQSFYGALQPMEVDIGCGRGRFLLARANSCPHLNFLGIDLSLLRLRKIDRKAVANDLTNIRLVNGEALRILTTLPTESISTFYVYFPDPWPKRRHHVRRLVAPPLVEAISKALVPNGIIHLCTDHHDYFSAMQHVWRGDHRFTEIAPYIPPPEEETDFCLIFKDQGLVAHRCSFQKKDPQHC
jgi:tRNA (guanine-N7-)-methyltransferase